MAPLNDHTEYVYRVYCDCTSLSFAGGSTARRSVASPGRMGGVRRRGRVASNAWSHAGLLEPRSRLRLVRSCRQAPRSHSEWTSSRRPPGARSPPAPASCRGSSPGLSTPIQSIRLSRRRTSSPSCFATPSARWRNTRPSHRPPQIHRHAGEVLGRTRRFAVSSVVASDTSPGALARNDGHAERRLCPTACPTGPTFPMAKPKSRELSGQSDVHPWLPEGAAEQLRSASVAGRRGSEVVVA
jgi:hypothetical protein